MTGVVTDAFGLVGHQLDDKYEVEAVVAQGGFAVVYRATHLPLRKPIAVKVLRVPRELEGASREAFLAKFALEARTIAALDHPAIVKVIDFGTSPMPVGATAPWMVLDWIHGVTLDADLEGRRTGGGRSPSECLALLRPVFEALAYAHDEGIAHRDVKPSNIMLVTTKRGERTTRVLDFGIAKVMNGEEAPATGLTATHNHQRTFSLFYASPEQIAGTRTGPWTDVYALGLVLTEMLTDTLPYRGDDVQDVYIDALSPVRPTPLKRGFDVGAWEAVLARAVSLKPAERYTDAREFLAALEAAVPDRVSAPTHLPTLPSPPRATADTLQEALAMRGARTPTPSAPRGGRLRSLGFVLVGALGAAISVVGYQLFAPPTRPVEVRVIADPAPPVAPVAPPEAVLAPPLSEVDAGAPLAQSSPDAGDDAPRLRAPVRPTPRAIAARPRVVAPPTPPVATPPTTAPPRATGHEIIPAE